MSVVSKVVTTAASHICRYVLYKTGQLSKRINGIMLSLVITAIMSSILERCYICAVGVEDRNYSEEFLKSSTTSFTQ